MFWSTRLESSTEIIQTTPQGPILRISFSGVYFEGVGHELGNYLVAALRQHRPAAVVFDFQDFRYRSGNDLGEVVMAFVRKGPDGKAVLRPCAIMATGRTAKSLMSLIVPAKFLDTFDLRFFEDVSFAAEHLGERLESATA